MQAPADPLKRRTSSMPAGNRVVPEPISASAVVEGQYASGPWLHADSILGSGCHWTGVLLIASRCLLRQIEPSLARRGHSFRRCHPQQRRTGKGLGDKENLLGPQGS